MSLLLVYIHWQEEIILLLPGGVNTHIDELQSASQILVIYTGQQSKQENAIKNKSYKYFRYTVPYKDTGRQKLRVYQ